MLGLQRNPVGTISGNPSTSEAVAPDHPDYSVPRFSREHAARYVGLPAYRQFDLNEIPHGRTRGMRYCFAQSDLDAFKATLKARARPKRRSD